MRRWRRPLAAAAALCLLALIQDLLARSLAAHDPIALAGGAEVGTLVALAMPLALVRVALYFVTPVVLLWAARCPDGRRR